MPSRPPDAGAPLEEWLRWQEALHPSAIALGLDRVRHVGERLGLIETPAVTLTVAGTNGKGSTTTLLSGIYRAAGYRVGTYTSPHLVRYNERVVIDGVMASDAELTRAFAAVEAARGDTALTYFEFGTLAALWLFREARVQVQVLEVGMGGRLDAVNIVEPHAAIVTNIGLDHVEFLGQTRLAIGAEKAGIFRSGKPAICVDPDPPASLAAQARAVGADFRLFARDFGYQHAADAWNWHGHALHFKKLPLPALAGEAQLRNAAGALAAVESVAWRLPVDEIAIRTALASLSLPGRFQRRKGWILDVAHNVEAASVLAQNLRAHGHTRCRIVLGMLSDKPVADFFRVLAPLTSHLHAAALPPPRGLTEDELLRRIGTLRGRHHSSHPDVASAVAAATGLRAPDETLVACGSFLTVAAALKSIDG